MRARARPCVCLVQPGWKKEEQLSLPWTPQTAVHMSPHTHTHLHRDMHTCNFRVYTYKYHTCLYSCSQPAATYLRLRDTHGHTVTHSGQPQWSPPKPSQTGTPSSALFETHYFTLSHTVPHRHKSTNTPATTQPHTHTHSPSRLHRVTPRHRALCEAGPEAPQSRVQLPAPWVLHAVSWPPSRLSSLCSSPLCLDPYPEPPFTQPTCTSFQLSPAPAAGLGFPPWLGPILRALLPRLP